MIRNIVVITADGNKQQQHEKIFRHMPIVGSNFYSRQSHWKLTYLSGSHRDDDGNGRSYAEQVRRCAATITWYYSNATRPTRNAIISVSYCRAKLVRRIFIEKLVPRCSLGT